jgi:hypothetical protein
MLYSSPGDFKSCEVKEIGMGDACKTRNGNKKIQNLGYKAA